MAEPAPAKRNQYTAESSRLCGMWRESGARCLAYRESVLSLVGQGRGGSENSATIPELRGPWPGQDDCGADAYFGDCFPSSELFCLSEGWGEKSPAEKCHLQPDTGARAFTNLPVTMTA